TVTAALTEWATPGPTLPAVAGYQVLAEIGRGGMGVVYKAREHSLGRLVALKFPSADIVQDKERLERVEREARTASAPDHPHVCIVHALGKQGQVPFIVMEYIEGETLQAQVGRRPALKRTLRWIGQAARALAAAHAEGVVHRDIKPSNLMLRGDGYLKVLDF